MPQQSKQTVVFKPQEIVEILIKQRGIHEGHWGIFVRFGLAATNINNEGDETVYPAAIVPVLELGIQNFEEPNGLTVDAAIVNPVK